MKVFQGVRLHDDSRKTNCKQFEQEVEMSFEKEVINTIQENIEKEIKITLQTNFKELELDSFGILMLVDAFEQKFNISLQIDDFSHLKTINDIVIKFKDRLIYE